MGLQWATVGCSGFQNVNATKPSGLQIDAVSVLQCVAVCCSALQYVTLRRFTLRYVTLRRSISGDTTGNEVECNVERRAKSSGFDSGSARTVTRYVDFALRYVTLRRFIRFFISRYVTRRYMQCTTTHCNALQHTAHSYLDM